MHLNRVDLNLFVVLDAIYAEGSVTRAAQRVNLTQSALSHALGRLRDTFDDPLFTRQGHVMVPTPLARALIGPVRQALHSLDVSVRQARAFDPLRVERRFTIALPDALELHVLPGLMRRVKAAAPGVRLASVRVERLAVESELAAGTVDLAIDVPLRVSAAIRRAPLLRDAQVVVTRADHPALAAAFDLDAYLAYEHVLVSSRREGYGLVDAALAERDLHRRIALRCQGDEAACRVVAATDLLLTMPEHRAAMTDPGLGNRILPMPLALKPIDVVLYWHGNVADDPANAWLRALVQETAAPGSG